LNRTCFEEELCQFWEECDEWIEHRKKELSEHAVLAAEELLSDIEGKVETKINSLIENALKNNCEDFTPSILTDTHHLLYELELKQLGADCEEQIHRYKENGQVGLSVVEGKITTENAMLVMRLNSAHHEKKGNSTEGICEDCICGKN
jgi:hypothetical protein